MSTVESDFSGAHGLASATAPNKACFLLSVASIRIFPPSFLPRQLKLTLCHSLDFRPAAVSHASAVLVMRLLNSVHLRLMSVYFFIYIYYIHGL